jgi:hypothetical protein
MADFDPLKPAILNDELYDKVVVWCAEREGPMWEDGPTPHPTA